MLKPDQALPRKQRHTARRLWRRLRDERGFTGGYTIVKDAVRTLKAGHQERFVLLVHRPGEARVDFGQVRMSGALRKVCASSRRPANAGRRNGCPPGKKDAAGGPLTGPPAADRAT